MRTCAVTCAFILCAAASSVFAQDSAVISPPKVLVIQREFVKPGKEGVHIKSETGFARAWAEAKIPTHYIALEAMSGAPRSLFLLGYPSFEAWQKDTEDLIKAGVFDKYEHMMVADGDLLSSSDQHVLLFDPEHSLRVDKDGAHMRYMEFTRFSVKPGRMHEFMDLTTRYKDAVSKVSQDANFAVYTEAFGGSVALVISTERSLAEDDNALDDWSKMAKQMGAEAAKKFRDDEADCIESAETNLYMVMPSMSYAAPEWIKADPFWKPKPAAAPAAKKPAAKQ